ncbi:hypothetical protein NQ318_003064, partial [Aromia moschata]
MGDLPSTRISQVKWFSHSGVDMAGPFLIALGKTRGAKTHKAYICLFSLICPRMHFLLYYVDLLRIE